jgi:hypothetical protein
MGGIVRGRCLTAIGRIEEGLALQRDAIAALRTMGAVNLRHLVMLADTCRRAGRLNEGFTALEELERGRVGGLTESRALIPPAPRPCARQDRRKFPGLDHGFAPAQESD